MSILSHSHGTEARVMSVDGIRAIENRCLLLVGIGVQFRDQHRMWMAKEEGDEHRTVDERHENEDGERGDEKER